MYTSSWPSKRLRSVIKIQIKNKSLVNQQINPPVIKDGIDREPKFKLNEYVRISRIKGIFEKGYLANWSQEIFRIVEIRIPDSLRDPLQPLTYKLIDELDQVVKGSFYTEELQAVKYPDVLLVERVLRERIRDGKTEILVKWLPVRLEKADLGRYSVKSLIKN